MKHTWERQPDEDWVFSKVKIWMCTMCGCKKALGYTKFATPIYQRSSITYTEYVECFDIEAENLKTID